MRRGLAALRAFDQFEERLLQRLALGGDAIDRDALADELRDQGADPLVRQFRQAQHAAIPARQPPVVDPVRAQHRRRELRVGDTQIDVPLLAQTVERTLIQQAAGRDDADDRRHLLDLGKDMRADDHRDAPFAAQTHDHLAHLDHGLRVQPVRRLVQQQELRLRDQRHRDAQPLLHPQRVVPRLLALMAGQTDLPQNRGRGRTRQIQVIGHHTAIIQTAQPWVEARPLDHRTDPARLQPVPATHLLTQHPHIAARGRGQPKQQLHRRGLARTIRPQQTIHAMRRHVQIQPVHREKIPIPLHQPARQHRTRRRISRLRCILYCHYRPPKSVTIPWHLQ